MGSDYRIDGHKLHLHPQRVAHWLEGKDITPIYMEISPSGACNHRCRFCALDFMGYKARFLPTDIFCERLTEMGKMGVKSIMYAGEGEPFLHKDMAKIAEYTKSSGIDVAFTTNASLLKEDTIRRILPVTSWIKVSCNAGTAKTYAHVHGTKEADFTKVMENMSRAVYLRDELLSSCTLGFQMVLLPENMHEVIELAKRVRDLGVDYLVLKPYSQHPQSVTTEYQNENAVNLQLKELFALNNESFSIIYRSEAIERSAIKNKAYERCLALPFWSYCDAGGQIWGCSMFLGNEKFVYGNILENSFQDVWFGDERKQSLAWCAKNLDARACRINCRMDAINAYLWELTHQGSHVNFI